MLSNYEVYSLLVESQEIKNQPSSLATVSYEDPDVIAEFLKALMPYNLTKAEKLQLLNLRPTSMVEVQLIVEELDERLQSEEHIERLIAIITSKLPDRTIKVETEETNMDDNEDDS